MDEARVVFTHAQLAELAGVKPSRLAYWVKSGLVATSEHDAMRRPGTVRLYTFNEALVVLTLASIREVKSLQHIRQIVNHIRQREFDVSEVRFALAGKPPKQRVFFQFPDGEWEDVRHPAQIVFHQVLDLQELRSKLRSSAGRDEATVGQTEKRRGALGSKPVIAGTRIPVELVQRYLASGRTTEQILAAYPTLTESDIRAVEHLATA